VANLLDYLRTHHIVFMLAYVDTDLQRTLTSYDLLTVIGADNIFGNLEDAVNAFHHQARTTGAGPAAKP
jgi:hypothetical protein